MTPLHIPRANKGTYPLLLDGVLSCGDLHYYVQAVPFGPLSIGGYGTEIHSVNDQVWVQSQYCARHSSLSATNRPFYRIQKPRSEYARYHKAFLWVADLGKHFVDYLQYNTDEEKHVYFSHFKSEFYAWIIRRHGHSNQFLQWHQGFGREDFRVAIAAHVEHLWTEATDMDDKLRRHFLWKEIDPKALNAIPTQISVCAKSDKTVVTPLIAATFKNIYFASMIETRVVADPSVKAAWRARKKALGFMTNEYTLRSWDDSKPELQVITDPINPRDVVGIHRDTEDTQTVWGKTSSEIWFGKLPVFVSVSVLN